jgi:hypothetical protein
MPLPFKKKSRRAWQRITTTTISLISFHLCIHCNFFFSCYVDVPGAQKLQPQLPAVMGARR